MSKSKISTFQFFSMLFLTRLLTTFTYIPSYTKDIELSDLVVQAVLYRQVFLYYRNSYLDQKDETQVSTIHSWVLLLILCL